MKTLSFRRLAVLVAMVSSLGCIHAEANSLSMNLAWVPTSDSSDLTNSTMLTAFSAQKLQLLPLTDERTVKEIGTNTEHSGPRPVSTPEDVAAFVTAHVAEILQANHILLVQSSPTRVLQGGLVQFFVREDNLYVGTVVLTFTLRDGAGQQLWQGVATGHSKRHGKSFAEENYNETLSESVLEAIKDLMKDMTFLDAVHGK